jgi:lipopolysaccharide export system protein LptA
MSPHNILIKSLKILLVLVFIHCEFSYAEDTKQAINITSDNAEFDDKTGTAIYRGNVIATQGSRYLESDILTIYRGKDNKINFMTASGKPANIKAQPKTDKSPGYGQADTIKYYPETDKALLIGNAKLMQDNDTISGEYLIYYFKQEFLQSMPQKNKRTKVVLYPTESH